MGKHKPKPKRDLFPITPAQKKFLVFTYDWIRMHGRVPSCRECMVHLGWMGSAPYYNTLKNLNERGWITRGGGGVGGSARSWWPIGVVRVVRFEYPATIFGATADTDSEINPKKMEELSRCPPKSLERLRQIAHFAGLMLGMADDDSATIKWAHDFIIEVRELLKPIVGEIATTKYKAMSMWATIRELKSTLIPLLRAIPAYHPYKDAEWMIYCKKSEELLEILKNI